MIAGMIILAGLASAGCLGDWPYRIAQKPGPETLAAKPGRARLSGVRPDQVNEKNARQAAQALEEELEADAEAPPLSISEEAPRKPGNTGTKFEIRNSKSEIRNP
jgi:hypothetical protein